MTSFPGVDAIRFLLSAHPTQSVSIRLDTGMYRAKLDGFVYETNCKETISEALAELHAWFVEQGYKQHESARRNLKALGVDPCSREDRT